MGFNFNGIIETAMNIILAILVWPFKMINKIPKPIRVGFVGILFIMALVVLFLVWKNKDEWKKVYWT